MTQQPNTRALWIGCFGASTGAAAALVAAAERPEAVAAVVSRGGRPDPAGPALLERFRLCAALYPDDPTTTTVAVTTGYPTLAQQRAEQPRPCADERWR